MAESSGELINYSLRPAKQIERKMLCETFRRLSEFGSVDSYKYIGFGSFYFSDFALFHRELGITNMISIEKSVGNKERFEFNKPFDCIKIIYGYSNDILPSLKWDVRTILWLDYDYPLDLNVLTDLSWFFSNAISGSVVIVTVDVEPDLRCEDPMKELTDRIGEERIPIDTKAKHLKGWENGQVAIKVINNHIIEQLGSRNGGRAKGTKFVYEQLFNFQYADSTKMLTVGGILYDEGQKRNFEACGFNDFCYRKKIGDDYYRIEIPKLTYRELLHLDAQLPIDDANSLKAKAIPRKDLKKYAEVYRYFPNFMEIAK